MSEIVDLFKRDKELYRLNGELKKWKERACFNSWWFASIVLGGIIFCCCIGPSWWSSSILASVIAFILGGAAILFAVTFPIVRWRKIKKLERIIRYY